MTTIRLFACNLLLMIFASTLAAAESAVPLAWEPAPAADLLAGLRAGHPRLLATSADWDALAERRKQDSDLNRLLQRIEQDGRNSLDLPGLTYKKQGRRLLAVSREAERRILLWSFCYRVTGDGEFARRAEKELLNLSEFPD